MESTMTYWVKNKIKAHLKFTNTGKVNVKRNYKNKTIVIDYFGGSCVKYNYNGKWMCG